MRLRATLGPETRREVRFVPVGERAGEGLTALASGRVDLLLCPVGAGAKTADGVAEIVGTTGRNDPRDLLLGPAAMVRPPEEHLRPGAGVAAPCVRSAGLLRAHYPGVRVVPAVGLASDLARVDRGDLAAVVAPRSRGDGMPEEGRAVTVLPLAEWVPGPGSGALAIHVRAGATGAPAEVARAMADGDTTQAVRAEMAVAQALGAVPGRGVGVVASPMRQGLRLLGMVVSRDGRQLVRGRMVARNGMPPAVAASRLVDVLLRRGAAVVGGEGEVVGVVGRGGGRS